MKIRLTHYGFRELIYFPALLSAVGLVSWFVWPSGRPWPQVVAALLILGVAAFFRDPQRRIPDDPDVLLAPADGKITDICQVDEPEFIKGAAQRIGIFLSVTDVHINRTPCAGAVEYLQEHPGKRFSALKAHAASEHNQANCLGLRCRDHPVEVVMVKQITGAIARRIVCKCKPGDDLAAGERFGMIKFGSRTELFLPDDDRAQIIVKKGDTVRAGTTILVRYKPSEAHVSPKIVKTKTNP